MKNSMASFIQVLQQAYPATTRGVIEQLPTDTSIFVFANRLTAALAPYNPPISCQSAKDIEQVRKKDNWGILGVVANGIADMHVKRFAMELKSDESLSPPVFYRMVARHEIDVKKKAAVEKSVEDIQEMENLAITTDDVNGSNCRLV